MNLIRVFRIIFKNKAILDHVHLIVLKFGPLLLLHGSINMRVVASKKETINHKRTGGAVVCVIILFSSHFSCLLNCKLIGCNYYCMSFSPTSSFPPLQFLWVCLMPMLERWTSNKRYYSMQHCILIKSTNITSFTLVLLLTD